MRFEPVGEPPFAGAFWPVFPIACRECGNVRFLDGTRVPGIWLSPTGEDLADAEDDKDAS